MYAFSDLGVDRLDGARLRAHMAFKTLKFLYLVFLTVRGSVGLNEALKHIVARMGGGTVAGLLHLVNRERSTNRPLCDGRT